MNNNIVVGIDVAMEKHQYQICDTKTIYSKGAIQSDHQPSK